jgi:hypothetical protein
MPHLLGEAKLNYGVVPVIEVASVQLIQSGIRTGRWVVQRITSSLRSAWEQPQSAGATDGARATRGGTAAINSRIPRISAGTQVQPPAARNILQGPGNEWRGHLPEGLFQVCREEGFSLTRALAILMKAILTCCACLVMRKRVPKLPVRDCFRACSDMFIYTTYL